MSRSQVEPVSYLGAAESDQPAVFVEEPVAAESDWRAERQDLVFVSAHQTIADGETETSEMTALEQETMDSRMTALEEENRLLRENKVVLEVRLDGLQNAFWGLASGSQKSRSSRMRRASASKVVKTPSQLCELLLMRKS